MLRARPLYGKPFSHTSSDNRLHFLGRRAFAQHLLQLMIYDTQRIAPISYYTEAELSADKRCVYIVSRPFLKIFDFHDWSIFRSFRLSYR